MSLNLVKSTWKRVALGDVVRNVNVSVRDPESVGIERVIAMEHLDPGELKLQRWGAVEDGTTFTRRVRPGQTLFGKRRAYQRKVAFAEFDAICSADILTFEADETQMLSDFLPFLVQSNRFFDHALGTSAGSLSPRTNWRDLSRYEFDLPPLDEQKRIADLLWAIELAMITIVTTVKSAADARQTWLDSQITSLVDRESVPFSQVWQNSPESGWSSTPVDEPTGRFVLSLAALGPEGYRPGKLKTVRDSPQATAVTLQRGDLLVSRANTVDRVGLAGIYSEDRTDVSFPDTMMRISLKAKIESRFALAVLSSSHGRAHMRRSAAGSATSMVKINRSSLGRLLFPMTSTQHQVTLLSTLDHLESAIELLHAESASVSDIRRSILSDVFGGN